MYIRTKSPKIWKQEVCTLKHLQSSDRFCQIDNMNAALDQNSKKNSFFFSFLSSKNGISVSVKVIADAIAPSTLSGKYCLFFLAVQALNDTRNELSTSLYFLFQEFKIGNYIQIHVHITTCTMLVEFYVNPFT